MWTQTTYCRNLAAVCGLKVKHDAILIREIKGYRDHPVSEGYFCSEGGAEAAVEPAFLEDGRRREADGPNRRSCYRSHSQRCGAKAGIHFHMSHLGQPGDVEMKRSGRIFRWASFTRSDLEIINFTPRQSSVPVQTQRHNL